MKKKAITITPIPRVEGDLEVHVVIEDGKVVDARSAGVLFRGFEKLLLGRDPMDALVFSPRICGICSIGQSTAASNLLRRFYGVEMPENAHWIRNIILASEMVMNHITHFYLFFGPDLANSRYSQRPGFDTVRQRFGCMNGKAYVDVIRNRKTILEILGILAGKWPNSLALQPGGVTRAVNRSDLLRVLGIWNACKEFVEDQLLKGSLEEWLANKSLADIETWLGQGEHESSDLGLLLRYGREWGMGNMGKGPGRFISCGIFELPEGSTWLKAGYFDGGKTKPFDQGKVAESVCHSWLQGDCSTGVHPLNGVTLSDKTKNEAYSWAKAPRYGGDVVEVGPLARWVNHGDPLAMDLFGIYGSSVFSRVVLRLHDLIAVLHEMEGWIGNVKTENPFYHKHEKKTEGESYGLAEVSRGLLGHWMKVSKGMITNYQVVSPTTWNLSPKDHQGVPGPAEQALIGIEVEDEKNPIEIGHVIRSFDPCLFCTVHTMTVRGQSNE